MPVYKMEACLRDCVESILAQTFADFELLLIDDGSPDTSGTICDEYAAQDKRVRVFHQENKGPSAARNTGLDNARGQWIAFVDSDDTVTPAFLETFAHLQKAHGADLVVTGYNSVDIFEKWDEVWIEPHELPSRIYEKGEIYRFHMLNIAFPIVWNKLFSLELIRENDISFDVSLPRSEDWIFVASYLRYVNRLVTSSSLTYDNNHWGDKKHSQSQAFLPFDVLCRSADTLYKLGLELSHDASYVDFLKYQYVWHLAYFAGGLYGEHSRAVRGKHIKILKELKAEAQKKDAESQYYDQLRQYAHIRFRNVYLIELNGAWIKLKRGIKTCIKACLPSAVLKAIRAKRASKDGAKIVKVEKPQGQ